ncbi:MAG: c-type cytochrome [Verrucomicrobiota bacterium]
MAHDHDHDGPPEAEPIKTAIGVGGSLLILAGVLAAANFSWGTDSLSEADAYALRAEERKARLAGSDQAQADEMRNLSWVNEEMNLLKIPVEDASSLVVSEVRANGGVEFRAMVMDAPAAASPSTESTSAAPSAPPADSRDAELWAMALDDEIVAEGKGLYDSFCLSCHGTVADARRAGDSPSNLYDDKWYFGSRPEEIERLIHVGALEKGMPPWKGMLPDEQLAAMTAYLLTYQTPPQ